MKTKMKGQKVRCIDERTSEEVVGTVIKDNVQPWCVLVQDGR